MTIQVSTLITKARYVLQDETGVRWPDAEMLDWFNSGQREVVMLRPDAKAVNSSVVLVQGTKQTLPAAGLKLIDVIRNMGADGTTPGRVIRLTTREVLDAQVPNWHTEANASGIIKHFVFDVRDPRTFYVYPQVPATPAVQVEEVYSTAPTDATTTSDNMDLDDIYEGPLINYLLFRAYSKEAEYASNDQKSANYYQYFLAALGVKTKVDITVSPNMNTRPFNPNVSDGPNTPGVV